MLTPHSSHCAAPGFVRSSRACPRIPADRQHSATLAGAGTVRRDSGSPPPTSGDAVAAFRLRDPDLTPSTSKEGEVRITPTPLRTTCRRGDQSKSHWGHCGWPPHSCPWKVQAKPACMTAEGAQGAALGAARTHTAPHPSHEETCKPRRPLGTSIVMAGMSLQADAEYSEKPDRNFRSDVHDDAVSSVSP